ncbi:GspH/FimT family pseudopilin [Marilutibacter aestuarii]|uniref:Type II secretion system protein H n=1 Tax=Marilutibacter aestuarii TaxID=1706195 RepID=A0A508ANP6_9GAMM|nr:GspH/FimT family pseudopilin [Lysobacter aestuarii]TQD51596.1 prepilin-type N-terminal cleavage/methylation domain-containing protein [Lysobacter aestuarii]
MDRNSLNRGFTLMELLAIMAVLGTLLAVASPPLGRLLESFKASGTSHRLTTSLALARIAAIKRGHPVTVCPSRDGTQCTQDGIWDEGWIVYADPGKQANPVAASDVLEASEGAGNGISVLSSNHRTHVRFNPRGWSAGHNLTVELCGRRHGARRRLVLNNAGRPRIEHLSRHTPCPG